MCIHWNRVEQRTSAVDAKFAENEYSYLGKCRLHDTSAGMTLSIQMANGAKIKNRALAEFYWTDGEFNVTYTEHSLKTDRPNKQTNERANGREIDDKGRDSEAVREKEIKNTHFNRNLITISMSTIEFVENVSFIAWTSVLCRGS